MNIRVLLILVSLTALLSAITGCATQSASPDFTVTAQQGAVTTTARSNGTVAVTTRVDSLAAKPGGLNVGIAGRLIVGQGVRATLTSSEESSEPVQSATETSSPAATEGTPTSTSIDPAPQLVADNTSISNPEVPTTVATDPTTDAAGQAAADAATSAAAGATNTTADVAADGGGDLVVGLLSALCGI